VFAAIEAKERARPPAWAVLERELMRAMDQAAPLYLEKYTRPGGALVWREDYPGDGVWADDLYEAFFNWPLYCALGGSGYIGQKAVEEWNALTRQITYDYGRATKEFINDDDWFHNSENYIYFYYLGLADPTNAEMMRRARRFAGLYMGEDSQAPNYDPEHRLIRSPFSGSRGPLFHARYADVQYNIEYGHAALGPGFAFPEKWYEDAQWREKVHRRFDEVVMRGDIPVNLGVVVLVTNAYLYSGEDQYRDWVVEYVEAWMRRIEENGGIIPDNVGLSGKIGEYRQGQWWGGFYGWTGRFSLHMMGSAMTIAAECAQLVTGEARYLELIRSQLDMLIERGREEAGRLLVPFKHRDEGWTEFRPMIPQDPIHLWAASMEERDWQRLERLRRGGEEEWRQVTARGPRSLDDRAWTRFLAGELPDYPEQILQANYQEVCRRLEMVLGDQADLKKVDEHHWQQRNPVVTEALVQLTTGGPQTIYWGGLAQGRVRYFDEEARRPGLPQDVGALVYRLEPEAMGLKLVNLSVHQTREVIVGAGSFGEHQFLELRAGQEKLKVEGRYFRVRLRPGTQIDLEIGMRRYANRPTYAFPWHGEAIPFR
jgi:hypothetical protein